MKTVNICHLQQLDFITSEAINTICTNLTFSGRDLHRILVTSNAASDGKSWIAMHMAVNLAKRGRRVLLIDGDMRRSMLVQRYNIRFEGKGNGLAHYLTGQCGLDECVYSTNVSGLCIMPAGRDVSNPVALIDTPYFSDMLDELARHFDVVLLDTPPIGAVIDAAEIAVDCDGAVLVVEYKKTRLREIAECKRQIERSGTPVLGCIINKVAFDGISEKRYYNRSYYSRMNKDYYRRGATLNKGR